MNSYGFVKEAGVIWKERGCIKGMDIDYLPKTMCGGKQHGYFLMPPSYNGSQWRNFLLPLDFAKQHTYLTWSDNEDGTTLTSPLSVFVSFDIGLVYVRTYVSEPPHQTLIACLSTGEESDNICVISTWWRAPREPAQEMIWVELSTINRLITTGWFSPSKPSLHRLIQIHPLWGHSCPSQSNRTTPTPTPQPAIVPDCVFTVCCD